MSPEDRIALLLGRAVMRAEALHFENEQLRARLAEHENAARPKRKPKPDSAGT